MTIKTVGTDNQDNQDNSQGVDIVLVPVRSGTRATAEQILIHAADQHPHF